MPAISAITRERESDDKLQYGIARYTNEPNRLCGVLDRRLADRDYIAGDYSIADMAIWCCSPERRAVHDADYPNVLRWFDAIDTRPPYSARSRCWRRNHSAGEAC
jgi:glutathione S-transferase